MGPAHRTHGFSSPGRGSRSSWPFRGIPERVGRNQGAEAAEGLGGAQKGPSTPRWYCRNWTLTPFGCQPWNREAWHASADISHSVFITRAASTASALLRVSPAGVWHRKGKWLHSLRSPCSQSVSLSDAGTHGTHVQRYASVVSPARARFRFSPLKVLTSLQNKF